MEEETIKTEAQQHPQHIQQQHQPQPQQQPPPQQQSQAPRGPQMHPQTTHPSQHQHAQTTGYAMSYAPYNNQHYPARPQYPQSHFAAGVPVHPSHIAYSYPAQYPGQPWQPSTFPATAAATPSSQEVTSTPHVTKAPLPKRERVFARITDPKDGKELNIKELAKTEPAAKSAASTGAATMKAPTNQSPTTETTKTNSTASANTNAATSSATTSDSNKNRTNTSSPPSISNILLRQVSEDTDLDKRQAAAVASATTITTTTTSTNATTAPSSTIKPATPTKPTPIAKLAPVIEPATDQVEVTKVNNINGIGAAKTNDDKQDESKQATPNEVDVEEKSEVDGHNPAIEIAADNAEEESKEEDKVTLNYEPGQYNPMNNRTGKKKYDKQFLIDVCEKICKLSVFDEDKRDDSMDNYSFPQDDPFKPTFHRNIPHLANNRQNSASGRPNHQNYMGRSSAGQERARKVIAPSSSLTQEVELKTVANPWKPPSKNVKTELPPDVEELEKVKKGFKSILNKLTPNNFDNLAEAVTALKIDTETKLGEVIDTIFAKALAEPGYCVLYGQMCSHLSRITTNFQSTLLGRCQVQFQSDIYSGLNLDERRKKIDEETNPDVKKHKNEELYEEMYRCRMRGLGLIKFIGELYKIGMLNDQIMFECIIRLLNDTSEESLECLCDLLVTIGEKLDRSSQRTSKEEKKAQRSSAKPTNAYQPGKSMASVVANNAQQQQQNTVPEAIATLDDIFDRLHMIRKNKDLPISLRIRFKLLDVCELREKENWQSKKAKDNNPKKIEEIRVAHREKVESEEQRARQAMGPRRSQEGRRQLGHSGGSSSQISSQAIDDQSDPYEASSKQHYQKDRSSVLAFLSRASSTLTPKEGGSSPLRPTSQLNHRPKP